MQIQIEDVLPPQERSPARTGQKRPERNRLAALVSFNRDKQYAGHGADNRGKQDHSGNACQPTQAPMAASSLKSPYPMPSLPVASLKR